MWGRRPRFQWALATRSGNAARILPQLAAARGTAIIDRGARLPDASVANDKE